MKLVKKFVFCPFFSQITDFRCCSVSYFSHLSHESCGDGLILSSSLNLNQFSEYFSWDHLLKAAELTAVFLEKRERRHQESITFKPFPLHLRSNNQSLLLISIQRAVIKTSFLYSFNFWESIPHAAGINETVFLPPPSLSVLVNCCSECSFICRTAHNYHPERKSTMEN